jgi:hypothetical protein
MSLTKQTAKHFRDIYFGGNWTVSSFKEHLADVIWQQAITKVYSFNTIATLVYHSGYYVTAILKVLQGDMLNAKDEYSFAHPPIQSKEDWEKMQEQLWTEAEEVAQLIEQLPDSKLEEIFADKKYGTYYRNLHGAIEHSHYHLGQIVLIKKLILLDKK